MSEIATSLAVSSLHHRCAADGKIRLRMFEGGVHQNANSAVFGGVRATESTDYDPHSAMPKQKTSSDNDASFNFASIQDQLSDFRSFGASLMVSSIHHEESKK